MKRALRRFFCACLLLSMLVFSAQAVFASGKLNINTATAAELTVLKGVGEKTAANIVAYREQHGNFKSTADLVNVKGIGEKTYSKLAEQITVEEEKK